MHLNQKELSEWSAGFFDGDGTLRVGIGKDERTGDYRMQPNAKVHQAYVSGLFDAEGCIIPGMQTDGEYRTGHKIRPRVLIQQIQTENDPLAKLIAHAESIDVDYNIRTAYRDDRDYKFFNFTVSNRDDLRRYLVDLTPHLTVKRKQAEIMASEVVPRINRGANKTKRDFLKTMFWVDKMNSLKGGNRGKYTREYFEDLWGMELSDREIDRMCE